MRFTEDRFGGRHGIGLHFAQDYPGCGICHLMRRPFGLGELNERIGINRCRRLLGELYTFRPAGIS